MKTFNLSQLMRLAWQFYKSTGQAFSECLRLAWRNVKLVAEMHKSITHFYYRKIDGSIREAWGSLSNQPQSSDRAKNETIQIYFDTECNDFRCFKKLNLLAL